MTVLDALAGDPEAIAEIQSVMPLYCPCGGCGDVVIWTDAWWWLEHCRDVSRAAHPSNQ